MQYCSNAGTHNTIKEEATKQKVGKGVRGWQGLRHGKGGLADFLKVAKSGGFLVQKFCFLV